MLAFVFSFVILGGRHGAAFLPLRDYAYFVGGVPRLSRRAATPRPEAHADGGDDA